MMRKLGLTAFVVLLPWLAGADGDEIPLSRLDSLTRAKVMMAILGMVLLGVGLIAMVMMGGRYVRRLARRRPEPTRHTVPPGMPKKPPPDEPAEEPDANVEPPRDEEP